MGSGVDKYLAPIKIFRSSQDWARFMSWWHWNTYFLNKVLQASYKLARGFLTSAEVNFASSASNVRIATR